MLLPISFFHFRKLKKQQQDIEKDENEDLEDVL